MDLLQKHVEVVELYEIYRSLLTSKQQVILDYYYFDNYSLSEISELESISRNAVYDSLKRTVDKLYDYESKLKLNSHKKNRLKIIQTLINENNDPKVAKLLKELEKVEQDGI